MVKALYSICFTVVYRDGGVLSRYSIKILYGFYISKYPPRVFHIYTVNIGLDKKKPEIFDNF